MTRIPRFPCFVTFVAFAIAPVLAGAVPSELRVEGAWVRWLPNGLPAAGYLTLVNESDADLALTGARTFPHLLVERNRTG